MHSDLFVFFFQAEDGIRDRLVTGVQTCALPICAGARLIARWTGPDSVMMFPMSSVTEIGSAFNWLAQTRIITTSNFTDQDSMVDIRLRCVWERLDPVRSTCHNPTG